MRPDHSSITERPGDPFTTPQLVHMHQRYSLAARHARGRDVLEAACGAGVGFTALVRVARRFVAGDVNASNVVLARSLHQGAIPVLRFDAQALPFKGGSFDVVVLLEAIYYVGEPASAAKEAARVLREGGTFIVSSVNPAWRDFSRSPLSVSYLDSKQLVELLSEAGFRVSLFGAFAPSDGLAARLLSTLRRTSDRLHIPWPRGTKTFIRSLIYGAIRPAPADAGDDTSDMDVVMFELDSTIRDTRHAIIYAIGVRYGHESAGG